MKRESHTIDRSHQVDSPAQRHLPLVDLLVDTRAELMEVAVASGLKVLTTMLEEDRTAICGPRYQHQAARQASRTGAVPSEVVLGGRKVAIRRPRVRANGAEVPLPTFQLMASEDPLNRRVVEQMLIGVPEAERVFATGVIDAERHHDAVLADLDPVDQQCHEIERVEGRGPPGRELRRGLRHEPTAHGTLARPARGHGRRQRLETARVLTRRHTYAGLGTKTINGVLAGTTPVLACGFLLKILATSITLETGGSGGIVTPIFFIGATSGAALASLVGVPTTFLAAVGLVAMLAAAANTPIAAAVMAMELLPGPEGVYAALAAATAFLMVGHRSVYASQKIGLSKSAGLDVELGGAIGDVTRASVRIRKGSLTERVHQFGRVPSSDK